MFKNREFRLRIIKTHPTTETITVRPRTTPEQYSTIAKDQVRNAAIVVGTTAVAVTVLKTASEIALLVAKAKIH